MLLQPKLFHRIFRVTHSWYYQKSESMDALSVVCSLLKLTHNNRCVKVWRSYKEEEEGEEVIWCKSEALEQGKKKRPWPEQGRRARNHLSRCTRHNVHGNVHCSQVPACKKCTARRNTRRCLYSNAFSGRQTGRQECKNLLDCFLHCSSRTCLVMASTRRTIPP